MVEEIVRRAIVDETEMARLLVDLEPFVFRLSYHLTRHQHDAEDLAQEVLTKLCVRLASFRGDSTLQTWVYTMVVNTHRDQLRKKKLRQAEEIMNLSESNVKTRCFRLRDRLRGVFNQGGEVL